MKNILITGANRGLGLGMVKSLCQNNPQNYNILFGFRNLKTTQKVFDSVKNINPKQNIQLQQVEVGNIESHDSLINSLLQSGKKIDVLVNNAGILTQPFQKKCTIEQARQMIDVNYYGTAQLTMDLLPFLSDNARIIFLGSTLGQLKMQGPNIQKELSDKNITKDRIDLLCEGFIKQLRGGPSITDWAEGGFIPGKSVSKAALHAWVRFNLNKHLYENQSAVIVSPGWCKTDLGTKKAPRSVEQGIAYTMELINQEHLKRDEKHHLKLFEDGKELKF